MKKKGKCSKRTYSKVGAMMALARINAPTKSVSQRDVGKKEKRYYYCYLCKAWHLTSRDKYK